MLGGIHAGRLGLSADDNFRLKDFEFRFSDKQERKIRSTNVHNSWYVLLGGQGNFFRVPTSWYVLSRW